MAHERVPKAELWGIDLASASITSMRQKYPYAIFEVNDVYHTKYPNNYFSYAVAGEVIEHLEKPEDFIKEAFRILKPGGILAISTPNEEEIEPGAVDKHRHLWSFSVDDIIELTKDYGIIKEHKVLGSQYFPVYKYSFPQLLVWIQKNEKSN